MTFEIPHPTSNGSLNVALLYQGFPLHWFGMELVIASSASFSLSLIKFMFMSNVSILKYFVLQLHRLLIWLSPFLCSCVNQSRENPNPISWICSTIRVCLDFGTCLQVGGLNHVRTYSSNLLLYVFSSICLTHLLVGDGLWTFTTLSNLDLESHN